MMKENSVVEVIYMTKCQKRTGRQKNGRTTLKVAE